MWVTSARAAELLGIHASTVRDRRRAGSIRWRETGNPITRFEYWVGDADPDEAPATAAGDDLLQAIRQLAQPAPVDLPEEEEPPAPRPRLIAAIFDVHVPDHDVRLWRGFLEWCRDNRPDEVVIGGDFLELASCSQHGGVANPAALVDDVKAGRQALDELREANPKATLTYCEGNHETRLGRVVVANLPTWDGVVDLPNLLELKQRGISWHRYGDLVRRGKIRFTHGYWCSMHHAKKHLDEYGVSVAYGHTHRPQLHTKGDADGRVHGAFGMPCMRRVDDVEWLGGKPHGWCQGFGAFYVLPDDTFTPYVVLAAHSRFVWNGRIYGGRL